MNKRKRIFAVLLALACAFALFACSSNETGQYVEGSDSVTIEFSEYFGASVDGSFDVYLPKEGMYEIEYTLEFYYDGKKVSSKNETDSKSTDGNETVTVDYYWSYAYQTSDSFVESRAKVRVTNVTATLASEDTEYPEHYNEFAIAFGTASAAMLGAMIALFVVLKKREAKTK